MPLSVFDIPFQPRFLLHEFVMRSSRLDDLSDVRTGWLRESEWNALRLSAHCEKRPLRTDFSGDFRWDPRLDCQGHEDCDQSDLTSEASESIPGAPWVATVCSVLRTPSETSPFKLETSGWRRPSMSWWTRGSWRQPWILFATHFGKVVRWWGRRATRRTSSCKDCLHCPSLTSETLTPRDHAQCGLGRDAVCEAAHPDPTIGQLSSGPRIGSSWKGGPGVCPISGRRRQPPPDRATACAKGW